VTPTAALDPLDVRDSLLSEARFFQIAERGWVGESGPLGGVFTLWVDLPPQDYLPGSTTPSWPSIVDELLREWLWWLPDWSSASDALAVEAFLCLVRPERAATAEAAPRDPLAEMLRGWANEIGLPVDVGVGDSRRLGLRPRSLGGCR
jgi:hypothetical protein